MEIAKISVDGVRAEVLRCQEIPARISGGQIRFVFDSSWEGLQKTVVFRGSQTVQVVNAGELVTIPQEAVSQVGAVLWVGVCGVDAENSLLIPTLWACLGRVRSSADQEGNPALDPALPVWAQLQATIGDPAALDTQEKTTLVDAINELVSQSEPDPQVLQGFVDDYLNKHPVAAAGAFWVRITGTPGAAEADKTLPEILAAKDQGRSIYCLCDYFEEGADVGDVFLQPLILTEDMIIMGAYIGGQFMGAVLSEGECQLLSIQIPTYEDIPTHLPNPQPLSFTGCISGSYDGSQAKSVHIPFPTAGPSGKDGFSPLVSIEKTGKVTTLTITDASGTHTAAICDGADGADGTGSAQVPAYWETALQEGVSAIRIAMQEAGAGKSAFLFYTDAHWSNNSQRSPALLQYLYRNTGITKTIFGGDIVLEETDVDYLWDWRSKVKALPNHHSVVGNHDDGNTTNHLFSSNYVYSYLLAPEETADMVRGDGLYYYIDVPAEKTRYLYLDTACFPVDEDTDQQLFVTEALRSAPGDWHIVAAAHIWYDVNYDQDPITIGNLSAGGSYLLNLFDQYNARTGVFADAAAKVEFCVGGHAHMDHDGASAGGIPVILAETDSMLLRSGLSSTEGTTGESSVNAIVADYAGGWIHVIRVGRGSSRRIPLSANGPASSYTNQLPIATDTDGTICNGIGYQENTRYSTSAASAVAASGWDLTGFIPAKPGDVIRLKNLTWYPSAENSGRGSLYWFSSTKEFISNNNIQEAGALDGWSPVYDSNNHIVQFTVLPIITSSMAYLRLCCQDLNENSIITVNEEITS